MTSAADRVRAALADLQPAPEVRTLSVPVPTAAAAAAVLGCPVGAIANSLVFVQADQPLLVVASGAHRVDTRALARRLGTAAIKRASPDFVLEHTGQRVGGVAPVGHPAALPTVVDEELATHDVVWAGGGDELTMFATTFEQLLALTGGTPAQVSA